MGNDFLAKYMEYFFDAIVFLGIKKRQSKTQRPNNRRPKKYRPNETSA